MRGLPETTTINDFQGLIRAEKDKQHVYTQDRDWPAVTECMTEIKSLASRQTRLGELEQQETEKYMELEEQIRSINHKMNVAEVNDVQSAEEQVKLQEEKQVLTQEQDAWRAFVDVWNSLEEPKKINLGKKNKMEFAKEPDTNSKEPEKFNPGKENKMEFAKEQDTNSEESEETNPVERTKMEVARISNNSLRSRSKEQKQAQMEFEKDQRRQELKLDKDDRNHTLLERKRVFYERMLQLGNHKTADELLLDITERITAERTRSTN